MKNKLTLLLTLVLACGSLHASKHKAKPAPPSTATAEAVGAAPSSAEITPIMVHREPNSNVVTVCSPATTGRYTSLSCDHFDITPASPEDAGTAAVLTFLWETLTETEKKDLTDAQWNVEQAKRALQDKQTKILQAHTPKVN